MKAIVENNLNLLSSLNGIDSNKEMRIINGNGDKFIFEVMFQNIPGNLNKTTVISSIEQLLHDRSPDILAIAEPDFNDLHYNWKGYKLQRSSSDYQKKCRLNCLIKDSLKYDVFHWKTRIPMCGVKVLNHEVVFVYREWAEYGCKETRSMAQQVERWLPFVEKWEKWRGKNKYVLGDLNYESWRVTDTYHRTLDPIRDPVIESIIRAGWFQLIRVDTRHQGLQHACLDHLYVNNTRYIKKIYNENHIGHDHNMIGMQLSSEHPVRNI